MLSARKGLLESQLISVEPDSPEPSHNTEGLRAEHKEIRRQHTVPWSCKHSSQPLGSCLRLQRRSIPKQQPFILPSSTEELSSTERRRVCGALGGGC